MMNSIETTGPALQIRVTSPEIKVEGSKKYVLYTVKFQSTSPVFEQNESVVQRRYSQFEWLFNELEKSDVKMIVPPLPDRALTRQIPFFTKDSSFDETFIEDRRQGLETFLSKVVAHPLAQNERSLHFFLFEADFDLHKYVRGRMRR